jgi:thiosulfate/3-mercaptopyruvate sulfurtransferase
MERGGEPPSEGHVPASLLVTPDALASELNGPSRALLLLDARGAEAFAAGHLPDAVSLDVWGFSLTNTDPAPLDAFFWMIEHVLALRGVTMDVPVVVYSDTSDARAARVFWFLEYFGHPDVRILDGGVTAWMRAGHPLVTTASSPVSSNWTGQRVAERVATWRDVRDRIRRQDAVIVDTRSDGEYFGTHVRAARGGAIPGATHVEWTNNLTAEGTFKPAKELQAVYDAAGIRRDSEVITYCQGGYRAAHTYLALRLLGYPRVRSYVGSWKEWGDRLDLPIEQPGSSRSGSGT